MNLIAIKALAVLALVGGHVLAGLTHRRAAEAALFRSGIV